MPGKRKRSQTCISCITKGLLKTHLQCQIGDNTLQGCSKFLQEVLNHCLICGAVSLIAQIHRFRNQGLEIRVAPFTIIPSDPLPKILLPDLATLYSVALNVSIPKGRELPPGDTAIPLNWKFRLPPSYLRVLVLLNQSKKGVNALAGRTDPDYQGYYSTMELRKSMSRIQEI